MIQFEIGAAKEGEVSAGTNTTGGGSLPGVARLGGEHGRGPYLLSTGDAAFKMSADRLVAWCNLPSLGWGGLGAPPVLYCSP